MSVTVKIKGLKELQRKFDNILPGIKRGVKAGTQHIEGNVKPYPPSTNANVPKVFKSGEVNSWYERGWGAKWAVKAGGWRGRKVSENLLAKWTVKFIDSGLTGIVGNNVSYGPYLQDEEQQTNVMRIIGWRTIQDVAEDELPVVTRFIEGEIQKELNKP